MCGGARRRPVGSRYIPTYWLSCADGGGKTSTAASPPWEMEEVEEEEYGCALEKKEPHPDPGGRAWRGLGCLLVGMPLWFFETGQGDDVFDTAGDMFVLSMSETWQKDRCWCHRRRQGRAGQGEAGGWWDVWVRLIDCALRRTETDERGGVDDTWPPLRAVSRWTRYEIRYGVERVGEEDWEWSPRRRPGVGI